MGSPQFDPQEVIDLTSSDVETSFPKKRRLEDDSVVLEDDSSLRDSKRAKTDQPETVDPKPQAQDPLGYLALSAEEGEIEDEQTRNAPSNLDDSESGGVAANGGHPSASSLSHDTAPPSDRQPSPSSSPHYFHHNSLKFLLPHLAERKDGSWLVRFQEWTRSFLEINSEITHALTPSLVQSAYLHYLDTVSGLKPKKRKSARQASKEFERTGDLAALLQTVQPTMAHQAPSSSQPQGNSLAKGARRGKSSRTPSISEDGEIAHSDDQDSESEAEYEPTLSRSEQTSDASVNGNSKSQSVPVRTTRNVPTGALALEQQRKYFPSATDPTQMCLLCGRGTHLAPFCHTLVCSFCGSLEHPDLGCPTRARCDNCRQLGHQAFQCVEKLSLASGEGLACNVCDSTQHLEKDCTMTWRSFHPEPGTINKVAMITATCAVCGNNQHFASDCKRAQAHMSTPTWSLQNCDQYIDPSCGVPSIERAARGHENAGTTRAPELRIRGHAARTTNVHYSESDDSDPEFLGHRPVRKAPVGHIRMASNIQMPGSMVPRGNNGQYQPPVQPPLPPGPPPPGPPSRQGLFGHPPPPGMAYGTQPPQGPPPSLPMKPPTSQSYQGVPPPPNQQGSGGRPGSRPPKGHRGGKFSQRGGRGDRGGRGGRGGGGRGGRGRGKAK